jgi:hypothetical protein
MRGEPTTPVQLAPPVDVARRRSFTARADTSVRLPRRRGVNALIPGCRPAGHWYVNAGQFNWPALNPGGNNHSVAADVPIAGNAWVAPATGPCAAGGGGDANGRIAVYVPTGSDP